MLFLDITQKCTLTTANKKRWTFTTANQKRWTLRTANRMLRNCKEDIRFCYDICGKSYNKYNPCYAVPHR